MAENNWQDKMTRLKLRPCGEYLVVNKDSLPETKSGLVIPETSQSRATTGRVMYVGPDVTCCKVGDRVLYGELEGMTCRLDAVVEDDFVVMRDVCVRVVIEE